jgi:hypothetical protein
MEVNIKNTHPNVDKNIEIVMQDFLKFCNIANPINRKINTVIYDDGNGGEVTHENKIVINVNNKTNKEILKDLSNQWMNIFSKLKNVRLNGMESDVLITTFLENNEQYRGLF